MLIPFLHIDQLNKPLLTNIINCEDIHTKLEGNLVSKVLNVFIPLLSEVEEATTEEGCIWREGVTNIDDVDFVTAVSNSVVSS